MATPKEFARRMRKLGENVEKNANAAVRKAALAIDTTVVLSTPVDTGRARSNWQVSLNAPAQGTLPAYKPGSAGDTGAANTQAAIQQGATAIAAQRPGDEVHITNNLPYIGRLNDGWSAQAPAGFVEKAILVGVDAIKDFAVLRERNE